MSRVSDISRQYHRALTQSQAEYEDLYRERAEATRSFYDDFFHRLVLSFHDRFENERFRARLHERIERATGTDRLHFIAVDGTCQREQFSDFVTFFGGAYGARGELDLVDGTKPQIRYKRWSLDQDVSMVAWVPIPFARLDEVTEREDFVASEEERADLASAHVQVMQLAEVFLAYNAITSSRLDAPHILLMDLSPSSVLAATARFRSDLGLIGYPYDRRALTPADVTVATAHPFHDTLGIPSPKTMDRYRLLVRALERNPSEPVDPDTVAEEYGLPPGSLRREVSYLQRQGVLGPMEDGRTAPLVDIRASWAYTSHLFQSICQRLFLEKDPGALQYEASDEHGTVRRRWMAPDDLSFLIAVGMRLLVEACWERDVLYYGVVKDSASRYLTRNYLGVTLETGYYPELADLDIGTLPWTDRIFCETLPLIDDALQAPWCTVEFDSAFMTLHRGRDPETEETHVAGVMGRFVNQERLFARSLGQFFLKRDRSTPLIGHVVFLERLLSPTWDWPGQEKGPDEIPVEPAALGRLAPYAWRDRDHVNPGQWVMMYLLSVLTPNHYAEAIGYPDPLHKADWGAKTVGRSVAAIVKSSTQFLRSRPLAKTFRSIRDRAGR